MLASDTCSESGSNHSAGSTKNKKRKNKKAKGFLTAMLSNLKNKETSELSEYDMFDIDTISKECLKLNELLSKTSSQSKATSLTAPFLRIMQGPMDTKIENLFDIVLPKL